MANEIEIFGKKVRIVTDSKDILGCDYCAFCDDIICSVSQKLPCENEKGICNRHFVLVTE